MQVQKDDIRKSILREAQTIFLQKGFAKASMRQIADASHIGLSNIYNYFPGKDEIFCTIVQPVVSAFEAMLQEHHGHSGVDIMEMHSEAYLRYVIDEYLMLLKKHRRLLQLLFFHAQGSSLEDFRENFTRRSTVLVKEYFRRMKEKHPHLHIGVSDFFIHLHTAWMFTLFEELLMHRKKPEELEQIITEYITFEVIGWRELMKI
ncbi:MAG: TetR/AcrR family transcriptional regulator [Bacteroidales bacterium]|nr:TetR/AcrR family transcriptional regulator [Bacteroidales bacterium]